MTKAWVWNYMKTHEETNNSIDPAAHQQTIVGEKKNKY